MWCQVFQYKISRFRVKFYRRLETFTKLGFHLLEYASFLSSTIFRMYFYLIVAKTAAHLWYVIVMESFVYWNVCIFLFKIELFCNCFSPPFLIIKPVIIVLKLIVDIFIINIFVCKFIWFIMVSKPLSIYLGYSKYLGLSTKDGVLFLPKTASTSSWARCWTWGFLRRCSTQNASVLLVVSEPAANRSFTRAISCSSGHRKIYTFTNKLLIVV